MFDFKQYLPKGVFSECDLLNIYCIFGSKRSFVHDLYVIIEIFLDSQVSIFVGVIKYFSQWTQSNNFYEYEEKLAV